MAEEIQNFGWLVVRQEPANGRFLGISSHLLTIQGGVYSFVAYNTLKLTEEQKQIYRSFDVYDTESKTYKELVVDQTLSKTLAFWNRLINILRRRNRRRSSK